MANTDNNNMYVQLYVDVSTGVDVLFLVQFNTTDQDIFICTPTKIEHENQLT